MSDQVDQNDDRNPFGSLAKGSWEDMENELINKSERADKIVVLDSTCWFLVHGKCGRTKQFEPIEKQADRYTFILAREVESDDVKKALKSLSVKGAQIKILGGNKIALPVEKQVVPVTMGIRGRIFCNGAGYTALFAILAEGGNYARLYLEDSRLVESLHTMLLNLSVEYNIK